MSNVSIPRFAVLNAVGALLWSATLAVVGFLLGNVLELLLGDLATVEMPLLIGLVVVAAAWLVHRHVRDRVTTGSARIKPDLRG